MLVYGDRSRLAPVREEIDDLRRGVGAVDAMAPGVDRHAALVGLFIRVAELAQGIADSDFEKVGEDRPTPTVESVALMARAFAAVVAQSWRGGFQASASCLTPLLRDLPQAPDVVSSRWQEGYAFYGVYPEAYHCAASVLVGRAPTVIGLRSIGLGLGAMLASSASAPLFISVRPIGHPFCRELALSARTKAALERRKTGIFAIADEGPGLSGSSFSAVAAALESLGVEPSRVHFFPSHGGAPGRAATSAVRARWSAVHKHVAAFESVVPSRLADWCAELTGAALEPLEDIGVGEWRRRRPPPASEAPIQPMRERRKYLLRSERGVFLLRFAGLGDYGAQSFARARALADAKFSPPVLGLRHGFLIERWLSDAAPLRLDEARREIIARVADYLAFRAHRLLASPESGARLEDLADMLALNGREGLGIGLDRAAWRRRALALESRVRRVQTDNRLHSWEWLRAADGSILKADAYDHCASHDLVGCQDIAWDVAGATIELDLSQAETEASHAELRARRVSIDGDLLGFLLPCYLAFQLGVSEESAASPQLNDVDRERSKSAVRRYCLQLKQSISQ